MVSELMRASSDLSVSRDVGPPTSAVHEENKLLQISEDLPLRADVGVSSCSK